MKSKIPTLLLLSFTFTFFSLRLSTAWADADTSSTTPVTTDATTTLSVIDTASTIDPAIPLAPEPTTTIHLKIETNDTELYNKNITVRACPNSESGTETTINGFCAATQAATEMGFSLTKTWYPFGVSVDGISSYLADFANNKYWLWYNTTPSTVDPGATGLESHIVREGETLLLTYNIAPLILVAPTTTPAIGATTTLTAWYFDNNTWSLATTSGLLLNIDGKDMMTSEDGSFDFVADTTTPQGLFVHKDGLVASDPITITGIDAPLSTTPATTGGGGGGSTVSHGKINTTRAIEFLQGKQHIDGSFGADLYSDWVAIAFASYRDNNPGKDLLKDYLLSHSLQEGLPITEYERRAMALESLGINPYGGSKIDYISKIVANFDGVQFGDSALINDDIFAIIPLLHAGFTSNDSIIALDTKFILSKQQSNGSWDSVDMTAGALSALSQVTNLPNVQEAITKAKDYLKTKQQNDGGFNNTPATSWVITGLAGLSPREDIENSWTVNNKNPQDYLASFQQVDGGVELSTLDTDSRVWATAYAIPAAQAVSWNNLLGSFSKSSGTSDGASGAQARGSLSAISSATSTPSVVEASTTPQSAIFETTTIPNMEPGTTTATSTIKIIKQIPRKIYPPKLQNKIIPVITEIPVINVPKKYTPNLFTRVGLSMEHLLGNVYSGIGKFFRF